MGKTNSTMRSRLLRTAPQGDPAGGGGGATPPAPTATPDLGDAGKAAIDRERESAAEANRLRAAEKARADAAEAELTKIREANQSEHEKAIAAAKIEGRNEVLSAANQRLVRLEVKAAAAASQFLDATDAVALLTDRLSEITVNASGDVDTAKVAELVKGLAEAKPHLVNTGTPVSGPRPLPGQGTPPAGPSHGSVSAGADEYRRRKGTPTT